MYKQTFLRISSPIILAATLAGCGGGDGGSSSPAPSVTPPPVVIPPVVTKQERLPISIADDVLEATYAGYTYIPSVDRQKGSLSYRSVPAGIVKTDGNGKLIVIKPGITTVTVTDEAAGYVTKEVSFQLTVSKWLNHDLEVQSLELTNMGNNISSTLEPRGLKGVAKFQVKEGSESLIRVSEAGVVTSKGIAGEAKVTVTDLGTDSYKASSKDVSVTISKVKAGAIKYRAFDVAYKEGLTLQAEKLFGADILSQTFSVRDAGQNVISINNATGLIQVLRAGEASVDVNVAYKPGYDRASEKTSFNVVISKSEAPNYVRYSTKTVVFEPNASLKPDFLEQPKSVNYDIQSGHDVVVIDHNSGEPRIANSGEATVKITVPASDKYNEYNKTVVYTITPAVHSGLKDVSKTVTYIDGLKALLEMPGQKGTLSIKVLPEGIKLVKGSLSIEKVGTYVLKVSDDGGRNYSPAGNDATLSLTVMPGQQPALSELRSISSVYKDNFTIDLNSYFHQLNDLRPEETIEIVSISNSDVVSGTIGDARLKINKNGQTTVTVQKPAKPNFAASNQVKIDVNITLVESALKLAQAQRFDWEKNKVIPSPSINGAKGDLSFKLADGANKDVVTVGSNGQMTLLHAGTTRVTVVDSGRAGFAAGSLTFDVSVSKASNTATVAYPTVAYAWHKEIRPTVSIDGMTISNCSLTSFNPNVEISDPKTCSVKVLRAGEYSVRVDLKSRDHYGVSRTIKGVVEKAPYPIQGVEKTERVFFAPRKEYKLDFGKAYGSRKFTVDSEDSKSIEINSDTGAFTVTNFRGGKQSFSIFVNEAESRDYLAGKKQINVDIYPPKVDEADRTYLVDKKYTDIPSYLGTKTSANLQETKLGVTGVRGIIKGTDTDFTNHGPGVRVLIEMQEINSGSKVTAHFYLTRNDGCDVSPARPAAIEFDALGYCNEAKATYRGNRLISLPENDALLTSGEWRSMTPIIMYRYGDRLFTQNRNGGAYLPDDGTIYNSKTARTTYEWVVISIKLNI